MRHRIRPTHVLALLLIAVSVFGMTVEVSQTTAAGADLVIDWWSVSAGGGMGNSAGFTLHGSIGQPDAGTATSSSYTVTGGILASSGASPITGEPPSEFSIFLPAVIK